MLQTERSFLRAQLLEGHDELLEECVREVGGRLEDYPPIVIYGRACRQRRSIGFFSDTSAGYSYSNQVAASQPLSDNLRLLLQLVNELYGASFNGVLVNRYNGGADSIGKHSDDEAGLDPEVGVVSLSYGAARKFRVRDKKGAVVADVLTRPGLLVHMGGDFQKEFTHEVPAEKASAGVRVSFTFRRHRA